MANQRAQLVTHALEDLHVPLPTRTKAEWGGEAPAPQHEITSVDFKYPELVGKKKDRMVSTSFRLPVSQVDALDALKRDKGIVPSELVRRLIADFLADFVPTLED